MNNNGSNTMGNNNAKKNDEKLIANFVSENTNRIDDSDNGHKNTIEKEYVLSSSLPVTNPGSFTSRSSSINTVNSYNNNSPILPSPISSEQLVLPGRSISDSSVRSSQRFFFFGSGNNAGTGDVMHVDTNTSNTNIECHEH